MLTILYIIAVILAVISIFRFVSRDIWGGVGLLAAAGVVAFVIPMLL